MRTLPRALNEKRGSEKGCAGGHAVREAWAERGGRDTTKLVVVVVALERVSKLERRELG